MSQQDGEQRPVRRGLPRGPEAETPAAPATQPPKPAPAAPRRGLPRAEQPSQRTPAAAPVPAPEPTSEPRRVRLSTRARRLLLGGIALLVLATIAVLAARGLRALDAGQDFIAAYPGETPLPADAPVGLPAWLAWQHFLTSLLIVLIIRSGWQVRTEKRPALYWTSRSTRSGIRKISISLWFHQALDVLFVANGVIFYVLLFATGQWMRVVPTSWDVAPNALSAGLQYVSLDWPTENGWVNYNSLQVIAYFVTIFIGAPLAIVTGVRMSGIWPARAKTLSRIYPVEWARAVHLPVMVYFVLFIFVHVTLVLATGALRNLNHMYGGQDAVNWIGFAIFVVSLLVIAGAWVAARPVLLAPIAKLFGTVGR